MSLPKTGWILLECPACATTLKAPPGSEASALKCPECGSTMKLGEGAERAQQERGEFRRGISILPESRTFDPKPSFSDEAESWMPGKKTVRPADIKGEIGNTADPTLFADPVRNRERRKRREREKEVDKIDWENSATAQQPRRKVGPVASLSKPYWITLCMLVVMAVTLIGLLGVKVFRQREKQTTLTAIDGSALPLISAIEAMREQGKIPEITPTESKGPRVYEFVEKDELKSILDVMKRFSEAESMEAMLATVREPERMKPLMEAWYARRPFQPRKVKTMPERSGVYTFKGFRAGSVTLDNSERRVIATKRNEKGEWQADWESFVGWCEVDWEDLPKQRPAQPVLLRCRLTQDEYYNYNYSDDERFANFRLSSFDGEHRLYGYVKRNAKLHVDIINRMKAGGAQLFAMVKIRYAESSTTADQVDIVEFVDQGWVLDREKAEATKTDTPATQVPAVTAHSPADAPSSAEESKAEAKPSQEPSLFEETPSEAKGDKRVLPSLGTGLK